MPVRGAGMALPPQLGREEPLEKLDLQLLGAHPLPANLGGRYPCPRHPDSFPAVSPGLGPLEPVNAGLLQQDLGFRQRL